jgi:hypothetical protein
MFWGFILVVALATILVKLGMLSVWVSILTGGLTIAVVAVAILAIALVWHLAFGEKGN